MHANYLDTLDWGILIAYFLILIGIGIWASLKRKKGSSLFLAERSLKWHHIGFSMWGTNVGPSMLIASASAGFTTGIVSGNYAWYAFVFICLLAFVFAPRYLGARITTLPEFMGRRFGQSTRNILAWYTIVTILISWLALTLFAGGILIRQVFDIPMWQSALILLVISAFFTMAGGLKAVAYTNVVTRNFAASLFRNIKYFTLRKLYLCRKWMQKRLQKTTTTGITLPNFDFLA